MHVYAVSNKMLMIYDLQIEKQMPDDKGARVSCSVFRQVSVLSLLP